MLYCKLYTQVSAVYELTKASALDFFPVFVQFLARLYELVFYPVEHCLMVEGGKIFGVAVKIIAPNTQCILWNSC